MGGGSGGLSLLKNSVKGPQPSLSFSSIERNCRDDSSDDNIPWHHSPRWVSEILRRISNYKKNFPLSKLSHLSGMSLCHLFCGWLCAVLPSLSFLELLAKSSNQRFGVTYNTPMLNLYLYMCTCLHTNNWWKMTRILNGKMQQSEKKNFKWKNVHKLSNTDF